ncbi:type II toxin-antitoxin system death-on-curing family toxin [Dongia sp.]|uniref:type II toxin-antitoxin system death-on-curing family toxin n=1 Tax=Dongia sp. TaxID=1977262 RepID=UPI0035B25FF0
MAGEAPNWVQIADVIEHNRDLVAITNEPHQILNQSLLESACERPYNLWHYGQQTDMPTLAAELMFGLARNHPFLQGNKRTAFATGLDFLEINGYTIDETVDELFGWLFEGVLLQQVPLSLFIEELAELIQPIGDWNGLT